ncbi:MAG: ribose-phosphate pyrophosphokinase [Bacteroidales bacterium]|nr:ribose-phosphate pyrophosphokinase [Bacteroidales bacterium]
MSEPIVSIFSGRASRYLAEKIVSAYGTTLGKSEVIKFSDGEFQTSYEENIRGRDVFIIQSTVPPADNIWELLMMIDAAKRASARKIVAVIPYFGYARQDRKDKPRVSIGAKMVTNLLTSTGIDRLITLDLHADQIQGFMDIPVDNLYASVIFYPYIQSLKLKNLMMASPDTGGTRRAASYAKALNTGFAICYKQRTKPNVVEKMQLIGDVSGKDVVLVDDIIDTAGTITKAAEVIMEKGANSVRALVTHPIFSGKAYEIIGKSPFKEVIVSDTIPIKENPDNKIKVISTANLFAEVIKRVENYESISSLFNIGDPNNK